MTGPRRRKNHTIQYLDEAELRLLFRAIATGGNARDLAIFEVAYHRALRASEVGRMLPGHPLGHTDIRNMMIYAKVSGAKRRRTGERLQGVW